GYADLLERTGDGEQAERWFDAVIRLDPDETTDAADRVAALRGIVIEYVDEDEEFFDEGEGEDEDEGGEVVAEAEVEAAEDEGSKPDDADQPDAAVTEIEFVDLNDAVAIDESEPVEVEDTDEQ
ncbi:MAG TPA: hypothetical protein VGK53_01810, partial [Propionicimonas sp.]